MNPVHGLVLGIIQGLAEFLPISSSGHLVVVPWLLGWPEHTLTFDVALHMGTLAALLAYFWRDWWRLVAAWLPRATTAYAAGTAAAAPGDLSPAASLAEDETRAEDRRLGLSLVVATIPGALIGALFASKVEDALRAPAIIALLMIVAGILLAAADRAGIQRLKLTDVGYWQAAVIGVAQAFALAPGVSRSGVTIAAALFLGLTREAAARYAFLMAAPITAGAGLFQLRHLAKTGIPADERAAFALGILASFAVGVLIIRVLLDYLRRHSLDVFVGYRMAIGVLVLVVAVIRSR